MAKKLTIALAAFLLLLMAPLARADADVLYSLSGVVGDSNWNLHPEFVGTYELTEDLSGLFQFYGGPGGLISIDYSGPPITLGLNQELYGYSSLTATCANLSGCYSSCPDGSFGCDLPGFSYFPFTAVSRLDCCLGAPIDGPIIIDSSWYVQDLVTPPFAPYGSSFVGYMEGYDYFLFDALVAPDALGQPFSLTVTTVADNSVPEPTSIADFGAAMIILGTLYFGRRQKPQRLPWAKKRQLH
jgi:hypothetical protein